MSEIITYDNKIIYTMDQGLGYGEINGGR